MATDNPPTDHVATFLLHQGFPLSLAAKVSDLLDTPEGRAVVARALRLYYPNPQTIVTVYGYDFDRDAADALFDRVMAAAHELDEEVTCVGGPVLEGRESVERTGDEGEH